MPEPISSSTNSSTSSFEPEPIPGEAGLVCRSEAISSLPPPNTSEAPPPPPLVAELVSAVRPAASALPPTSAEAAPSQAQNSAQRGSEQRGIKPYFDYGPTGARDAVFVGVAGLKGRDPKSGGELEVLGASVQIGGQNEVQAVGFRGGVSGKHGSASGDVFSARAHGGAHNDDGSTGFNAGAGASIFSAEGTLVRGTDSATLGLAVGVGAAISVGVRDIDNDDIPEYCAKLSVLFLTLGACAEN